MRALERPGRIRVSLPEGAHLSRAPGVRRPTLVFSDTASASACAEAIGAAIAAAHGRDDSGVADDVGGVFRREGDFWTVAYGGEIARLRDRKGMRYLAMLLAHPGREFCALDMAVDPGVRPLQPPARGRMLRQDDLGPILDAEARASYRRRLAELRDELADAERLNDRGRRECAQAETDCIMRALATATALGGRDRRTGSDLERARVAVTLRIRDAVARITEHLPALGRYLAAHVETGRVLLYCLDSTRAVRWRM